MMLKGAGLEIPESDSARRAPTEVLAFTARLEYVVAHVIPNLLSTEAPFGVRPR